jgi:hypothetical protein
VSHRPLPVYRQAPPPPKPGDVLYVAPLTPRDGRLCANCVFWDPLKDRCPLFRASQKVTSSMVCSYHVPGLPQPGLALTVEQPLEPATAGLLNVGGRGTRCGTCQWFRMDAPGSTSGLCMGVAGQAGVGSWSPAQVDAWGCCSRWTGPSAPVR